jgi:hypothetical protein
MIDFGKNLNLNMFHIKNIFSVPLQRTGILPSLSLNETGAGSAY